MMLRPSWCSAIISHLTCFHDAFNIKDKHSQKKSQLMAPKEWAAIDACMASHIPWDQNTGRFNVWCPYVSFVFEDARSAYHTLVDTLDMDILGSN